MWPRLHADTVVHTPAPNSSSCQHLLSYDEPENRNLLPGDFQVQLDGTEVIDVNSHHLGSGCKQLFGLTGHTAYQDVSCQSFEFCDLVERAGGDKEE